MDAWDAYAVSIHARHATGDVISDIIEIIFLFQFTPVMRRATCSDCPLYKGEGVSIHARHATGDVTNVKKIIFFLVSIHARHATGD